MEQFSIRDSLSIENSIGERATVRERTKSELLNAIAHIPYRVYRHDSESCGISTSLPFILDKSDADTAAAYSLITGCGLSSAHRQSKDLQQSRRAKITTLSNAGFG